MFNGNFKKILGIFWFIIFVLAIFALGFTSGSSRSWLKDYFSQVASRFEKFIPSNRKNSLNQTVASQKLQPEETMVINVVDKVSPSVVSIVAKTRQFDLFNGPSSQESGIGTGFIVDSTGLIVTNSHVVDDPSAKYSVVLKDGRTFTVDKVYLDETTDIAIISVTARDLPVVDFGDSDTLKVGQKAIAIGNALGQFQNTVTSGVISGISRQIEASGGLGTPTKAYDSVIQTDAALNPGNSGGPLLNSAGQVIGINVATTLGANNVSFAIPINTLKPILQGFLKHGRIIRPYIGVYYVMITKELAAVQNMPEGAYVSQVATGAPAEKAGLQRGDIITKINDLVISTHGTLASAISKFNVGDTIQVTFDRDGKVQTVKLTLAEAPTVQPQQ